MLALRHLDTCLYQYSPSISLRQDLNSIKITRVLTALTRLERLGGGVGVALGILLFPVTIVAMPIIAVVVWGQWTALVLYGIAFAASWLSALGSAIIETANSKQRVQL